MVETGAKVSADSDGVISSLGCSAVGASTRVSSGSMAELWFVISDKTGLPVAAMSVSTAISAGEGNEESTVSALIVTGSVVGSGRIGERLLQIASWNRAENRLNPE